MDHLWLLVVRIERLMPVGDVTCDLRIEEAFVADDVHRPMDIQLSGAKLAGLLGGNLASEVRGASERGEMGWDGSVHAPFLVSSPCSSLPSSIRALSALNSV